MTVRTLPRPRTFEDMCDRLERVEANVGSLITIVQNLATNVGGLIEATGRIPSPLPPMRNPEDTLSNYVPKFPKLRDELRDAVKDPHVKLDGRDADRIVEEALEKIAARRELGTWRWVKGLPKKATMSAIRYAPHWLFAGGAMEAIRWLLAHK